jgi:hypothetical protein
VFALVVASWAFAAVAQPVSGKYKTHRLDFGIRVTLSASWRLLEAQWRSNIQEQGAAIAEQAQLEDEDEGEKANLLAAHNLPLPAAIRVRVSRTSPAPYTADEVRALSQNDLNEVTAEFAEALKRMKAASHGKLNAVRVDPVQVALVNGHPAIAFSYMRAGIVSQDTWYVTQYKIPRPRGLVELTISYKTAHAWGWEPVARKVRDSFEPGR